MPGVSDRAFMVGKVGRVPMDYETERRRAAIARSYTTPAIITLVLYFIFWLPGAIANLVYLSQARNDRRLTGHQADGHGCLVALAIVFVALPIVGFCLAAFAFGLVGAGA